MSNKLIVNISEPKYQKLRRSRWKWTYPPNSPRTRYAAANNACRNSCCCCGSRIHCHLKYIQYIWICSTNDACRSLRSGLPYWPRLKLYMKASFVPDEKVHETSIFVRHAVGSPSLIAGKCAARIGCVANGVKPR